MKKQKFEDRIWGIVKEHEEEEVIKSDRREKGLARRQKKEQKYTINRTTSTPKACAWQLRKSNKTFKSELKNL